MPRKQIKRNYPDLINQVKQQNKKLEMLSKMSNNYEKKNNKPLSEKKFILNKYIDKRNELFH